MEIITRSGIKLSIDKDESVLQKIAERELGKKPGYFAIRKKSLDARDKGNLHYLYTIEFAKENALPEKQAVERLEKRKLPEKPVLIVGSGPAGLFCALRLLERGIPSIVVDRGPCVDERAKKIERFCNEKMLDKNGNVQFGEGGAGTFSDGKLNTQTHSFYNREVLETFVKFGAPREILWLQKPHVGSDNLKNIVRNMRCFLIENGCKVRFDTQLIDIKTVNGRLDAVLVKDLTKSREALGDSSGSGGALDCSVKREDVLHGAARSDGALGDSSGSGGALDCSVKREDVLYGAARSDGALGDSAGSERGLDGARTGKEEWLDVSAVVLAVGHSARDTFELLLARGVHMSQKEFAVGVRIEHLQSAVGLAQYGKAYTRLPAADYKLVSHAHERAAFTFCMCPGGVVMPAASEDGGVVTNGMSNYARDEKNANSALIAQVRQADFGGEHALAGVEFQRRLERAAFVAGGGDYRAPAQRLGDFLKGKVSAKWGEILPSYAAGVSFADLNSVLPLGVCDSLKAAALDMDRRLKGFANPDAVLTGVESRTSSPVRIERGEDLQSVTVKGLFPCGEGAGYAGGITSAAADGIRVADGIFKTFNA